MNKARALGLAAIVVTGSALPALADWNRLGEISVSARETARSYSSFGGPVEKLNLRADRSDVYCRSVRVTFANRRTRNVFSGTLREDRAQVIDLPGGERTVRRIDFRCRATERRNAQIQIAADIGRYRETWRRHPSFNRLWSHLFNWDDRGSDRYKRERWASLGSERFEGRERETTFIGFGGRGLTAIGLTPVDDDAHCSTVRVHFANGRSRTVNLADRLREDQLYRVDLPGNERNVTKIELVCRPIGDNDVTINIYGLS